MTWQTIRRWLAVVGCIALAAFGIASWYVGSQLVAPANHRVGAPPADLSVVTTSLSSESGSELATWYVPNEKAHATIVLLHPIRGDRRSMLGRAKLFHEAGYAIVMIDLQAHGESPGRYITAGFLERFDVMAAIDFARTQNPNHRIGIVGCSLGGAASLLAGPLDIDALVLESVYPTISEAVHDRIAMRVGLMSYVLSPVLLCQLKPRLGISSSELRPIDYVSNVGCPILIAGGDVDEHTTIAETQRLFDAAAEPKKLVIFKGADHTDLLHYDRDQYGTEILSFLNTHLNASNK